MKHPDIDHGKYRKQLQTDNLIGLILGLASIAVFLIIKILSDVLSH